MYAQLILFDNGVASPADFTDTIRTFFPHSETTSQLDAGNLHHTFPLFKQSQLLLLFFIVLSIKMNQGHA